MKTTIIFYKGKAKKAKVPVKDWIKSLPVKAQIKCVERIELLSEMGHGLRRPYADILKDGIYELRIVNSGNQYRILYFFDGVDVVVLSNSLTKKTNKMPNKDIELAKKRKLEYEANKEAHTYKEKK